MLPNANRTSRMILQNFQMSIKYRFAIQAKAKLLSVCASHDYKK